MKKKVIFYFFKFSVLFFSVFLSCNEGYLGQDIQMEKLNDVGKAFMTHLLSNPDGKQQWEKLIRKGDIPPNEVALVFQGSRGWQYILPLLKDSTLIGMIIFPIEVTKENTHLAECLIDIPLVLEKEKIVLNKYGRMRLKFLKENRKAEYTIMFVNGTLNKHLKEIQETAQDRIDIIIEQLKQQNNLTEEMKNTAQLYWVSMMNNFRNTAEEIVLNELIYV